MKLMRIISAFIMFSAVALSACADVSFGNFFIFGDSLSDVGNVGCDLPYNVGGRWTNGKVWNEYLAEMLKIKVPVKSDSWKKGDGVEKAATNFSHASGKVKSYFYPITSVEEQINGEWVSGERDINASFKRYGKSFSPSDLIAIWGGANDYIMDLENGKSWIEKTAPRAALEQAENIKTLVALGAKTILIINLPDIGMAPLIMFPKDATYFSRLFNEKLSVYIAEIKRENPQVRFVEIDTWKLVKELVADCEKYGFKYSDRSFVKARLFDSSANPDDYVFYDGLHPSTKTHKILAEKIRLKLCEK